MAKIIIGRNYWRYFLQMEQIRALCNNIIANVLRHLDPLEGSVHSVVADNVRFELEKGMKDILITLDGCEEVMKDTVFVG